MKNNRCTISGNQESREAELSSESSKRLKPRSTARTATSHWKRSAVLVRAKAEGVVGACTRASHTYRRIRVVHRDFILGLGAKRYEGRPVVLVLELVLGTVVPLPHHALRARRTLLVEGERDTQNERLILLRAWIFRREFGAAAA